MTNKEALLRSTSAPAGQDGAVYVAYQAANEITNKEALQRITLAPAFMGQNGGVYANYIDSSEVYLKDIATIYAALDRLERLEAAIKILYTKNVDVFWLKQVELKSYNQFVLMMNALTQEEYDLLKDLEIQ